MAVDALKWFLETCANEKATIKGAPYAFSLLAFIIFIISITVVSLFKGQEITNLKSEISLLEKQANQESGSLLILKEDSMEEMESILKFNSKDFSPDPGANIRCLTSDAFCMRLKMIFDRSGWESLENIEMRKKSTEDETSIALNILEITDGINIYTTSRSDPRLTEKLKNSFAITGIRTKIHPKYDSFFGTNHYMITVSTED